MTRVNPFRLDSLMIYDPLRAVRSGHTGSENDWLNDVGPSRRANYRRSSSSRGNLRHSFARFVLRSLRSRVRGAPPLADDGADEGTGCGPTACGTSAEQPADSSPDRCENGGVCGSTQSTEDSGLHTWVAPGGRIPHVLGQSSIMYAHQRFSGRFGTRLPTSRDGALPDRTLNLTNSIEQTFLNCFRMSNGAGWELNEVFEMDF